MVKTARHFVLVLLLLLWGSLAYGQDAAPEEEQDESSDQVEQRDDSYRRQMELEDARSKDRTYVDTGATAPPRDLEKIDKLPQESRENIRDQLIDVIVENGEWEPSDILEEYPYEPTDAARADPELMQQEQEAWDEQIEKYHEREASAFGAHRGPVPGPGNPTGQQGGQAGQQGDQQGEGGQGGQSGQGGQAGGQDGEGKDGSAGTYQPGASGSSDDISTEGVSESALDFLRGGQGRQQPQQAGQPPAGSPASGQPQAEAAASQQDQAAQAQAEQAQAEQAQAAQNQADQTQAEQAQSEPEQSQSEQQESSDTLQLDTRGIIAIEDLDKLEGTDAAEDPDDSEDQ